MSKSADKPKKQEKKKAQKTLKERRSEKARRRIQLRSLLGRRVATGANCCDDELGRHTSESPKLALTGRAVGEARSQLPPLALGQITDHEVAHQGREV